MQVKRIKNGVLNGVFGSFDKGECSDRAQSDRALSDRAQSIQKNPGAKGISFCVSAFSDVPDTVLRNLLYQPHLRLVQMSRR